MSSVEVLVPDFPINEKTILAVCAGSVFAISKHSTPSSNDQIHNFDSDCVVVIVVDVFVVVVVVVVVVDDVVVDVDFVVNVVVFVDVVVVVDRFC